MSFAAVAQLWWLAPLGGVIVALYLLRMRRRDQRVPATFLWPTRTEEVRANALLQRLRFNWLMVLQLLALALLVVALARPISMQRGLTSNVTVFIVDVGASMGAIDVKPSRLSQAKGEIAAAIEAARPQDRIALIEVGAIPRVLCSLSSDKARLRTALQAADQTDAPPAMGEGLRLAAALCADEAGARIVVLSDGVFPKVTDFAPGRATVLYRKIGIADANLAISALGVSDTGVGRSLYCSVANDGKAPMSTAISLYADGRVIDSRQIVVAGDRREGFTLPVSPTAHIFEARLTADDDLKADNYAVAVTDVGSHLRVLLVAAGGDPFLEKALALDPRVTLDKTQMLPETEQLSAHGNSSYDLIVFDGVPEVPVKAASTLTFGAPGPASPAVKTGDAAKPEFSVAEDVPLMTGVDLRSTFIESAAVVTPRSGATTVATARTSNGTDVPLVLEKAGARRQIFIAFRPGDSDLPLQFGFPILISNALDFLSGEIAGGSLVVPVGAPISLPASGPGQLTGPDGQRHQVEPVGGSLVLRGLNRVGTYKLDLDGKTTTLFATLRDPVSSHIAPLDDLSLGAGSVTASTRPVRTWDLWRYGLLAALLTLGSEWYLFARRS